jgi:glycosyltransferase involved in cell wall biosynthesis
MLKNLVAGQFWLSVGTIEPRKNQKLLAQAYARYLALGGDPKPLIFAGGTGWEMDGFEEYVNSLGISEHVIMTGYVSDDELIWLYRNCYANIYPSLFEGFGLPVLEGMQFGAPTIASNSTSIPEVTGDAALLIDPEDTDAWSQGLLQLSKNQSLRDLYKEKASVQAERFSWKSTTASLLDLYHEAVSLPKREVCGP